MTSAPYDLTLLDSGSFVDNILVFNYWTQGILFTGFIVAIVLIVFAVARYGNVPTLNAFISTFFASLIISIMFWLFRFNGEPAVPTLVPIMLLFALGGAIVMKVMDRSTKQID
jgi:hypothetical protein